MKTKTPGHDQATLAAVAVPGFIVACVSHEAVGHGGMCLLLGRHITLLTSVYFRCSIGSPLIDSAGPLMNLVVGVLCRVILRRRLSLPPPWRLFWVFALAFNLFWGAGYFIFSAATNQGDWAFVLRDLALQPLWLWRVLMGVLGVGLYFYSIRLVGFHLPAGTPLVVPYLVAGVVSCVAALCYAGPTLPAVREAARESFGAGVGLLLLAYRNARRVDESSSVVVVESRDGWVLASLVVSIAFAATLGRGLVFERQP